ncbi:MAG: hypothetical protein HYW90_02685 [Candidatus Sungbacteria bacterium]|nr:hypothetical protein [Candidatus Sungbacteria bacterium]
MKETWQLKWFSSAEKQLSFVNHYLKDLNPILPHITDVQLVVNPWRFWTPYGVYFRSAWMFRGVVPDFGEAERIRHNYELGTGQKL